MGCGSCANENAIKAAMIRYQVSLVKTPMEYFYTKRTFFITARIFQRYGLAKLCQQIMK